MHLHISPFGISRDYTKQRRLLPWHMNSPISFIQVNHVRNCDEYMKREKPEGNWFFLSNNDELDSDDANAISKSVTVKSLFCTVTPEHEFEELTHVLVKRFASTSEKYSIDNCFITICVKVNNYVVFRMFKANRFL